MSSSAVCAVVEAGAREVAVTQAQETIKNRIAELERKIADLPSTAEQFRDLQHRGAGDRRDHQQEREPCGRLT